jgi:hypothetical protein
MAHAARIEGGVVRQVIVIPDVDTDEAAASYCNAIGLPGEWVLTSYIASIRGKYAGIGDTYDGTGFTSPPVGESITAAYERGKSDGVAETLLTFQKPEVM